MTVLDKGVKDITEKSATCIHIRMPFESVPSESLRHIQLLQTGQQTLEVGFSVSAEPVTLMASDARQPRLCKMRADQC